MFLIMASALLLAVLSPLVPRRVAYSQAMRSIAVAIDREGSHFEISLSQVEHGREIVLASTSQKNNLWLKTISLLQHLPELKFHTCGQQPEGSLISIFLIVEEPGQTTQRSLGLLVNPASHRIFLPDYRVCWEPSAAEDSEIMGLLDAILP